jgi:two-component system sensor histidine kinase VicK
MVDCDSRLVELAIDNLISNAIKFSRPGGKVHVTAQNKGEFVMTGVSDNGIGIPAEDVDRIFEKFYRAGNRGEVNAPGTGLGLAIAREVITRHGGKIWCESEAGGTKFFFLLRVAERLRLPQAQKADA